MLRDAFEAWALLYPPDPQWRDGTFEGHPAAAHVRLAVPTAVKAALGSASERYRIKGSAGQSEWTHTPWVALLDPAGATSVEEGIYVVYLLSRGNQRLYLTLNQGCTTLYNEQKKVGAREELARRASVMRKRVKESAQRLTADPVDLGATGWRAELYEAGQILSREYRTDNLPADEDLKADLLEALDLYSAVLKAGGWTPDDVLIQDASDEAGIQILTQAKLYNQHRRIERNSSHSLKVKKAQGTICKACDTDPTSIYGELGNSMVDAHHLAPLSSLNEGESVTFDIHKDFAVLCPNCHRAIHRMADVGDIEGLRRLISEARGRS